MFSHEAIVSLTRAEIDEVRQRNRRVSETDMRSLGSQKSFTLEAIENDAQRQEIIENFQERIEKLAEYSKRYKNIFYLNKAGVSYEQIINFINTADGLNKLEVISNYIGRSAILKGGLSFEKLGDICSELGAKKMQNCFNLFVRIASENYYRMEDTAQAFKVIMETFGIGFERFVNIYNERGGPQKLETILSTSRRVLNRKCITLEQALLIYDANPYPKEYARIVASLENKTPEERIQVVNNIIAASHPNVKAEALAPLFVRNDSESKGGRLEETKEVELEKTPAFMTAKFLTPADTQNFRSAIVKGKTVELRKHRILLEAQNTPLTEVDRITLTNNNNNKKTTCCSLG